ncbi:hypothetical protein T03_8395 [Trichinella britovi]|uniref:Uncharacterized protein n=1 Tax=Trichinella britovi TaxID=45882 RepID=A0A0V1C585_TRIBR|nr:hypothetical protein T03_8395 [Trichinella britovi]
MPGADVERGNRPPGTQGRLTEYLPPSRRSSSSNAFIATVPSAVASSAGAIPSASISQNLRKSSSSEPSPCSTKTPASGVRFRTALPHVIQPRRVSTATDPPVALLMRPVTSSRYQPTHQPPAALFALSASAPPRLRFWPVPHPRIPSAPLGPLHTPERLHPRAGTSTAGALGRSKLKFHSAPSALWPHTTSQCREAATLMGPSESEDIRHILTDEGNFCPRVEEAIYYHMVPVWPVRSSADRLEAPPRNASGSQETLAGST